MSSNCGTSQFYETFPYSRSVLPRHGDAHGIRCRLVLVQEISGGGKIQDETTRLAVLIRQCIKADTVLQRKGAEGYFETYVLVSIIEGLRLTPMSSNLRTRNAG